MRRDVMGDDLDCLVLISDRVLPVDGGSNVKGENEDGFVVLPLHKTNYRTK